MPYFISKIIFDKFIYFYTTNKKINDVLKKKNDKQIEMKKV